MRYFPIFSAILFASLATGQDPNAIFMNADLVGDQNLAAKGQVTASTRLAYRHLTGSAGTIDGVKAYNYLTPVAPKSTAASAWIGFAAAIRPELASKGIDGVSLLQQASNAGDPVGMTLLGRLYHLGKGVPQNTATARALYSKAAPNFALASTFLGQTYMESPNVADHVLALPHFINAAAAGETQGLTQLALMYIRGDGVPANISYGVAWLKQGAQRGDPTATYQRGLLYFRGQGVPKSLHEAVALYRRAAAAGYAPAQADLGVCYAKGQGVTKDLNQASYWLSLAAPTFSYAGTELALLKAGKLN